MIMSRRPRRPWHNSVSASTWSDSTYAEIAWEAKQTGGFKWAIAGIVLGLVAGLIAFAPAAWLAGWVQDATGDRILLSAARGTIWSGSALPVLTAGPGSRDATTLPSRISWTLGLKGLGFQLNLRQPCCMNGTVSMLIRPGFGTMQVQMVPPPGGWVAQVPSAWLGGLGTPWNTLQLGGTVRLVSPGFTLESAQGRWRLNGRADLELVGASSRLSSLESLGSYRLTLSSDPQAPGTSQLNLSTMTGALQLTGAGTWNPAGVRFRGEASAADADQAALNNLLNIIGRRNGARSVISIG
jgi:general secretion pathway protein N